MMTKDEERAVAIAEGFAAAVVNGHAWYSLADGDQETVCRALLSMRPDAERWRNKGRTEDGSGKKRILGMTKGEIMSELRDFRTDGVPASGTHRMREEAIGPILFLAGGGSPRTTLREGAREAIERLFSGA